MKMMKIDDDVHEMLFCMGKKGETFSDIIKRIIKERDEHVPPKTL
jgi:predicted CopG family antitoxin